MSRRDGVVVLDSVTLKSGPAVSGTLAAEREARVRAQVRPLQRLAAPFAEGLRVRRDRHIAPVPALVVRVRRGAALLEAPLLGTGVASTKALDEEHPLRNLDEGIEALKSMYDEFGSWIEKWMWFYDQQGSADTETVLGMVKYCASELGIQHIFIDSLMKCVKGEDDYNGQKYFVDTITAIARDYNVHVHLVHHLRKPKDENEVPDKHDNKGSGSITDQVDNVMMVWRNKRKEDDMKVKGDMSNHKTEPDARLLCRKQREYEGNDEGEPTIRLWYDRESQQYLPFKGAKLQTFYRKYPHRDD